MTDDRLRWILTGEGLTLELDPDVVASICSDIMLDIDLFGCGLLAGVHRPDRILAQSASPTPTDSIRTTIGIEPGHEGIERWMDGALLPGGTDLIGGWVYTPNKLITLAREIVRPLADSRTTHVGLILIGPGLSDLEAWVTPPKSASWKRCRLTFNAGRSMTARQPAQG